MLRGSKMAAGRHTRKATLTQPEVKPGGDSSSFPVGKARTKKPTPVLELITLRRRGGGRPPRPPGSMLFPRRAVGARVWLPPPRVLRALNK